MTRRTASSSARNVARLTVLECLVQDGRQHRHDAVGRGTAGAFDFLLLLVAQIVVVGLVRLRLTFARPFTGVRPRQLVPPRLDVLGRERIDGPIREA